MKTYYFFAVFGYIGLLWVTGVIMVRSFIFEVYKIVHPVWPVTLFIAIVMGIGYFFNRKTKEQRE